jgi:hypothetical protein
VAAEDFDDALKTYYSSRGIPLAGMAEAAGLGLQLPSWLRNIMGTASSSTSTSTSTSQSQTPIGNKNNNNNNPYNGYGAVGG